MDIDVFLFLEEEVFDEVCMFVKMGEFWDCFLGICGERILLEGIFELLWYFVLIIFSVLEIFDIFGCSIFFLFVYWSSKLIIFIIFLMGYIFFMCGLMMWDSLDFFLMNFFFYCKKFLLLLKYIVFWLFLLVRSLRRSILKFYMLFFVCVWFSIMFWIN